VTWEKAASLTVISPIGSFGRAALRASTGPQGAESLRLKLSPLTSGPATWREVTDNLERNPGAPWLAPIVEECMRGAPETCLLRKMAGYEAFRVTPTEARRSPPGRITPTAPKRLRSCWKTGPTCPGRWPASSNGRTRWPAWRRIWAERRWLVADQPGILNVVYGGAWPGGALLQPNLPHG